MRNLTNNINRINKKADNEKRRVEVRKYRAIGRALLKHQDEIDKLNTLLYRMGVEMDEAQADPAAVDALHALLMARRARAEKRAEKRKKDIADRAAARAAAKAAANAKKRPAKKGTVDAAAPDADIAAMMRQLFDIDIE